MSLFKKATKEQTTARVAIIGPSGSGKTYTALLLASEFAKAEGKRVALIDSEHGSAAKYGDIFDFDTIALESYSPEKYIEGINAAIEEGYGAVVVDSLSHAWAGKGGILEYVDEEKRKSKNKDAFSDGWGKATPRHNALVEALLSCERRIHLFVTMRSKMEHVKETDPSTGKTRIRKVGMQPIQREGLEYEFDVVGDMDQDNAYAISKSRCPALSGRLIEKPGKAFAAELLAWLRSGVKVEPPPPKTAASPVSPPSSTEPVVDKNDIARIFAVAKKAGFTSSESLHPLTRELFGVESVKLVPKAGLDRFISRIEAPVLQ